MHIQKTVEILRISTRRGAGSDHKPSLIIQLGVPLDRVNPDERGILLGYQDEEVTVTFSLKPLPDPNVKPLDVELAKSQKGLEGALPERVKPLPDNRCVICGKEIGDDFTADWLTPPLGKPQPVHGSCKEKAEPTPELDPSRKAELFAMGEEDLRAILAEVSPDTPLEGASRVEVINAILTAEEGKASSNGTGSHEPRRRRGGRDVARVLPV